MALDDESGQDEADNKCMCCQDVDRPVSKPIPPVLVSSSEEEEEECEAYYESDDSWEPDLGRWKDIVDASKTARSRRDHTLDRDSCKAGEVGSLKEITVGYAGGNSMWTAVHP